MTCIFPLKPGSIDIVDALLIARYYMVLEPANFVPGNVDTDCDEDIDIVDTYRKYAG